MIPALTRLLSALALALLLSACSDMLNDPAPAGPRPLAILLSSTGAPSAPSRSLSAAFDKADAARVRVTHAGESVADTVFAFAPGEQEKKLELPLDPELAREPLTISVELRRGESLLFQGSNTVTMEPSGTTQAEVALDPVVARVAVTEEAPTLAALGATLQLAGSALFATGDDVTGLALAWRALDGGVVDVTPGGQAVARAEGEARVEGSLGSLADTALVRVRQAVGRVVVTPETLTLRPGETGQLAAAPADANGNPTPGRAVAWSSSHPAIVAVDPATGSVRALALGAATVTATVDGVGGTAAVSVQNPAPVLSGLAPSAAVAGGGDFTLVVSGSGFVAESGVLWNGAARPTEFVGAGELRATIAAADVAAPGSATVAVSTPAPGGGTSGTLTFAIELRPNPVPSVQALSPTTAVAGEAGFELTVTGQDFVPGAVVRWNGDGRPTQFVGETELRASISAGDLQSAGDVAISVFNPAPGGGASTALTFTVQARPHIVLSAGAVSFAAVRGSDSQETGTVAVTNGGGGTVTGLSVVSDQEWLTATLDASTAPATVTLEAQPYGLPLGVHVATVTISSPAASNSPQVVTVELTVTEPPPVPIVWQGSSEVTQTTRFGGPPYCYYNAEFRNVSARMEILGSVVLSSSVTAEHHEATVDPCPYLPLAPSIHQYTMARGEVSGDIVRIDYVASTSNAPVAALTFTGSIGAGSVMSGTFVWNRTDQPSPLDWTIRGEIFMCRVDNPEYDC